MNTRFSIIVFQGDGTMGDGSTTTTTASTFVFRNRKRKECLKVVKSRRKPMGDLKSPPTEFTLSKQIIFCVSKFEVFKNFLVI